MYAGDMESYYFYKPILDYVIKKYHKIDPESNEFQDMDANSDSNFYVEKTCLLNEIKSTRIRCSRNLAEFPFPSSMNKLQREMVEEKILVALDKLPEEFKGRYYPIKDLTEEE